MVQFWTPPPEGWLKISYTCLHQENDVWSIAVARSSDGSVVAIQVDIHSPLSLAMANVTALREAMHLAHDQNWHFCIFESDSKVVLDSRAFGAESAESTPVIDAIHKLKQKIDPCFFGFVPFYGNRLSHNVLTWASHSNISGRINPGIIGAHVLSDITNWSPLF